MPGANAPSHTFFQSLCGRVSPRQQNSFLKDFAPDRSSAGSGKGKRGPGRPEGGRPPAASLAQRPGPGGGQGDRARVTGQGEGFRAPGTRVPTVLRMAGPRVHNAGSQRTRPGATGTAAAMGTSRRGIPLRTQLPRERGGFRVPLKSYSLNVLIAEIIYMEHCYCDERGKPFLFQN